MIEGVCQLCLVNAVSFEDGSTWEVAHVKSFKEGGEDNVDNYRPICRHCNRSMQSKHFKDYCREKHADRFEELIVIFQL